MQVSAVDGGIAVPLTEARQESHALEAGLLSKLFAENGFLANLAVIRAGDKMAGALPGTAN